jgi:hypothetical protein
MLVLCETLHAIPGDAVVDDVRELEALVLRLRDLEEGSV